MTVEILTQHHLEFLSLKEGCTDSSESTLIKMPHCWKSHVTAHLMVGEKVHVTYGPRREKTCLRGVRQNEFQTSLLSYRDQLEN